MSWQQDFDPEVTEASARACLTDVALTGDGVTYKLPLNTTSAHWTLAPGIYRVFLAGRDATATVLLNQGTDSSVTAVDPSSATSPEVTVAFAGDETVRIRVPSGIPELAARLLSGSGSLYLTRVVTWKD